MVQSGGSCQPQDGSLRLAFPGPQAEPLQCRECAIPDTFAAAEEYLTCCSAATVEDMNVRYGPACCALYPWLSLNLSDITTRIVICMYFIILHVRVAQNSLSKSPGSSIKVIKAQMSHWGYLADMCCSRASAA